MAKTYSAGKSIEAIKKAYGLKQVIKLASNENNYGMSPILKKKLQQQVSQVNLYPNNDYPSLKNAIADFYHVKNRNVLLGNGSDEILFVLLNYLIKEKDEVLLPTPSFQMYPLILKNNNKNFKSIKLKNWQYDLDKFKQAISSKTKMIILCNPNNPTGTYISHKSLEGFLKTIPKSIYVLVDEAYMDFADEGDFPNSLLLLKKYKNLIVLRTGSKFYSLAGLRFGFGFASNDISDLYYYYKLPFSINKLLENIGPVLFKNQSFYLKVKEKILQGKEYLYASFDALGIKYEKSAANFIFLYNLNSKFLFGELLKRGIIVRELESFGVKGGLRVTIGRPWENKKFIKELKKIYET